MKHGALSRRSCSDCEWNALRPRGSRIAGSTFIPSPRTFYPERQDPLRAELVNFDSESDIPADFPRTPIIYRADLSVSWDGNKATAYGVGDAWANELELDITLNVNATDGSQVASVNQVFPLSAPVLAQRLMLAQRIDFTAPKECGFSANGALKVDARTTVLINWGPFVLGRAASSAYDADAQLLCEPPRGEGSSPPPNGGGGDPGGSDSGSIYCVTTTIEHWENDPNTGTSRYLYETSTRECYTMS